MARGFVILQVEVTDAARYQHYLDGAQGVVPAHGGRVIVGRQSRRRPVEGDWNPELFFVIEFPSYQAAETFYLSDAYQAAVTHRLAASVSLGMLVEEQ